jgi:DNA-binding transcriptional MerR regulator
VKPLRYPIRAVAKLTGIPVDTLRAWERRYQVVEPARDERGRMYSEQDVERLRLLRAVIARGHAIGRIAALTIDDLRALLAPGNDVVPPPPTPDVAGEIGALRAAVDRFDAAALRHGLSRLAAELPARALVREVVLPLLRAVGEAWRAGTIDVAQEHLVSSEVRSLVGGLARLHDVEGARVVLATPQGELHELGVLAAALIAAGAGLGVVYLGPSLPATDVASAARRVGARAVVLGFTDRESAPSGPEEIARIARALPTGVELWIGGAGAAAGAAAAGPRAVALEDFDAFERAVARLRTSA